MGVETEEHPMHVSLTDRLNDYVREKVASGLYNNASEVVREALRRQIEQEMSEEARLARLREAIDIGWEQAERGEVSELNIKDILRELDAEQEPVG
ncbi:MAG: CopG family transcriptional regulator [Minwuia thermotolerans]|nr:MAG: CopG family transcriptional regulator [Minwuia thermotolerans]